MNNSLHRATAQAPECKLSKASATIEDETSDAGAITAYMYTDGSVHQSVGQGGVVVSLSASQTEPIISLYCSRWNPVHITLCRNDNSSLRLCTVCRECDCLCGQPVVNQGPAERCSASEGPRIRFSLVASRMLALFSDGKARACGFQYVPGHRGYRAMKPTNWPEKAPSYGKTTVRSPYVQNL
jgi:hypothetical protein